MTISPPLPQPSARPLRAEHQQILRSVSRSFHLTIRLLPKAVQHPVALGYLLARATDTVADTSALPLAERQNMLAWLAQTLDHSLGLPEEQMPSALGAQAQAQLARLTQAFATHQSHPGERALMQALPECLPLLMELSAPDRALVREVLGHITRGQQADLMRFDQGLNALACEAELDEYTWQVAGSVGEFWTALCGHHLPHYAHLPQSDMMALGRQYGMGLQRLNILRDSGEDLAHGRCYWPKTTLAQVGLTPQTLALAVQTADAKTLQTLGPIYDQWVITTHQQLAAGMRYGLAVRPWRLRLATALPALIGARTLHLLQQAGPMALTQRVKLPRQDLRNLLWQIALGGGSATCLERLFEQAFPKQSP